MDIKNIIILLLACLHYPLLSQVTQEKVTNSKTELHLLTPDYPVPYGPMKIEDISVVLDRIYTFLDAPAPAKMIGRQTNKEIVDLSDLNANAIFEPGIDWKSYR